MADTINARIPPRVEHKLAEYCARSGESAYSRVADLIPRRGTKAIRSDKVRELARKAFRGRVLTTEAVLTETA